MLMRSGAADHGRQRNNVDNFMCSIRTHISGGCSKAPCLQIFRYISSACLA